MARVPAVPAAILGATPNLRAREAMMVGSHLEGGWEPPFGIGDNGTSFGPYQMHIGGALTASGLSPKQAEDPTLSTKAMLQSYQSAVNQISESTWTNNPELAAEQSARIAESPAQDYYTSQGRASVDAAWSDTQDVLTGKKSQGGMPTINATTTADFTSPADTWWGAVLQGPQGIIAYAAKLGKGAGGTSSISKILTLLYNLLSNPADVMERGGLIVFGAIIIIVGLYSLSQQTSAGRSVSNAATRGVSSNVQSSISGQSQDRQRRMALAEEANKIGERKLALKERREDRLSTRSNIQAPAVGKHRKAS
jgi:hypothetical protein